MSIWTKDFWKATAERAISTAAQSGLAVYGMDAVNVLSTDWRGVLGTAAGGAVLAVLKALAASRVGDSGPSLTGAEALAGPVAPRTVEYVGRHRPGPDDARQPAGYWGG